MLASTALVEFGNRVTGTRIRNRPEPWPRSIVSTWPTEFPGAKASGSYIRVKRRIDSNDIRCGTLLESFLIKGDNPPRHCRGLAKV